jgi:hypothetical protein
MSRWFVPDGIAEHIIDLSGLRCRLQLPRNVTTRDAACVVLFLVGACPTLAPLVDLERLRIVLQASSDARS